MLLQNRFNQIDSRIISVETEISNLQAQLSELQQHRQHLQSVEQACESALTQTETALMMLNHVDPDCIQTFKDAMMAKFDATIAQLPEAPENDATPESEPTNPTEPEPNAITVEATEPTEQEPDTVPGTNPVEPDTLPDTLPDTVPDTTPQNGKQPLSVGSAAFNPSEATLDDLKRYVRTYQDDDTTRQYGTLTRRSTWEVVARKLLNG